jgi:hypothetical protein
MFVASHPFQITLEYIFLLVESWPNGPGKMNSSCSGPFIVENVEEMDFPGNKETDT